MFFLYYLSHNSLNIYYYYILNLFNVIKICVLFSNCNLVFITHCCAYDIKYFV